MSEYATLDDKTMRYRILNLLWRSGNDTDKEYIYQILYEYADTTLDFDTWLDNISESDINELVLNNISTTDLASEYNDILSIRYSCDQTQKYDSKFARDLVQFREEYVLANYDKFDAYTQGWLDACYGSVDEIDMCYDLLQQLK